MPNSVRKRRRRGRRGRGSLIQGPSPASMTYRGPTVPRNIANQEQTIVKLMSLAVAVSTNGSGVIDATFGLTDPSTLQGWSGLAAIYDEYRVLAAKLEYVPSNGYNKIVATQSCKNPVFVVMDRDSVVTLVSTAAALSYDSVRMFDLERPFRYDLYKMEGARESTFITTAFPTNLGAYAFWSTGNTASLQYGNVLLQLLVQFRASA